MSLSISGRSLRVRAIPVGFLAFGLLVSGCGGETPKPPETKTETPVAGKPDAKTTAKPAGKRGRVESDDTSIRDHRAKSASAK